MRVVMRNEPGDELDEGVELIAQRKKRSSSAQALITSPILPRLLIPSYRYAAGAGRRGRKARKRAMKNLVNSWQERLQLISVINNALKASNAALLGALIMHVYAAFLLIRYKLKEATREELQAEGIKLASSPLGGSIRVRDVEQGPD
ncbi:hypothetical protein BU15DRAFT_72368 [Melanogaster broomeanus]|nr:hypothetical protein BU15DRAFT_72368 [Melanogaster broomeanus]